MFQKMLERLLSLCFLSLLLSLNADLLIAADCKLNSPQDVVDCALANHPDAQRAALTSQQAEEFESLASQRPNPELSGRSVFGKSLGDYILNHEMSLAHTLELGGKRGSRIDKALAEKDSVVASSLRSKEEALLETIRGLFRIRQLKDELHTLEEALETFSRIQKQFRSRLRRTPEQEVSLGVFDLAAGDYQLRKASLESELSNRIREIELSIGRDFQPSEKLLPLRKKNWPEMNDKIPVTLFNGSTMGLARAGLKLAEADLSVAQSLSWPNVKIGPTFESQTTGSLTNQAIGVNLSFELPLFQMNGGGRAVAQRGLDLAQRSLFLREQEVLNQRKALLTKYSNAVKALEASLSHHDLDKKHKNADVLFARGIIPSSLVIEAHRQLVDFTKNRNEQELSALESLWGLYILEGRAFGEKL